MTIDDLITSDRPFLKALGADAVRYKREHDGGQLSDEQFAKLSAGLTNLEKLNLDCVDEVAREKLAEAAETVENYLLGKL